MNKLLNGWKLQSEIQHLILSRLLTLSILVWAEFIMFIQILIPTFKNLPSRILIPINRPLLGLFQKALILFQRALIGIQKVFLGLYRPIGEVRIAQVPLVS